MKCKICFEEKESYLLKEDGVCINCSIDQKIDSKIDSFNSDYNKKIDEICSKSTDSILDTISENKDEVEEFIVTTSHLIDGYKIKNHIDVVSSECVFGVNILKDLFVNVSDIVGGRNKSLQKLLKEAKNNCLSEIKEEANNLGANAIIALNFNYQEFSGGSGSMLFLVVTGTAVQVSRN